jgi:hypothetical protein
MISGRGASGCHPPTSVTISASPNSTVTSRGITITITQTTPTMARRLHEDHDHDHEHEHEHEMATGQVSAVGFKVRTEGAIGKEGFNLA